MEIWARMGLGKRSSAFADMVTATRGDPKSLEPHISRINKLAL